MFAQRYPASRKSLFFLAIALLASAVTSTFAAELPEIFVQTGHSARIESVAFSPDGRLAVSGGWDRGVVLWDVETGREVRRFSGHSDSVSSVAFSPDGTHVLSGSWDRTLRLWDVNTGREVQQFGGYARGLAVSPNGGRVLLGNSADSLSLLDLKTGSETRRFSPNSGAGAIAFSRDGKLALTAGWDGSLKLWNAERGLPVRLFDGHSGKVTSVAFSADGLFALSGGMDKAIRLWDVTTGREVRRFEGHAKGVTSVAFSPDGALAFSGGMDGAVRAWDVRQGNERKLFKGYTEAITSIAVSPNGGYILAGSADSTMRLWDTATGTEVRRFCGQPGMVATPLYREGTPAHQNAPGNVIGTRYSFNDGEWVVVANENFYSSSANGDRRLNVRIGNDVYGLEQFRAAFRNPARVEAALKGEPAGASRAVGEIRPPAFAITSPENGRKVKSPETDITVRVDNGISGLKKLDMYVNGKPMPVSEKAVHEPGTAGTAQAELKIPIRLVEGENVVEIVASNGFSEARRSVRIYSEDRATRHEKPLPDLWLFSVGINRYQDQKIISLRHAVADAEEMAEAFKAQEGKMYRKVHTLVLTDTGPLKPTLENIRKSLGFVMQVGPEDHIVLFLAGHGIEDSTGDFVYFPSDAVRHDDGEVESAKAVSLRKVLEKIALLPAKKMIVIDACRTLKNGEESGGRSDMPGIVKSFGDDRTVVFIASSSGEGATEMDEWKHGVFSYALIEGLRGKADNDGDSVVYMKELDEYVSRVVARATRGLQHPAAYAGGRYLDFAVAMLR